MSVSSWGWCPTCRKTQRYVADRDQPLRCQDCGGASSRTDPVDALLGIACIVAFIALLFSGVWR